MTQNLIVGCRRANREKVCRLGDKSLNDLFTLWKKCFLPFSNRSPHYDLDLNGCANGSVAPRNMMAKIRRMNFTLLTQSGWTQDQDSCSLSELLALRSLACGSPARHRVFFNVGKAGNLSSAKEVPEASEATDHVFFPEAVSPPILLQNLPAT